MAIDLLSEYRISLTTLAREQGVAVSTTWRWCLRGIQGHRLESINVGGRRYTTREAFARWVARVNGEPVRCETRRQREAAIKKAERELREVGV